MLRCISKDCFIWSIWWWPEIMYGSMVKNGINKPLSPWLIDVGMESCLILFGSWFLLFIIFDAAVFVIVCYKTITSWVIWPQIPMKDWVKLDLGSKRNLHCGVVPSNGISHMQSSYCFMTFLYITIVPFIYRFRNNCL